MLRALVFLVSTLMLAFMPETISSASADDSQGVRTQSGKVRCYVNENDVSHGGGPLVVCQYLQGFPQAPETRGIHWDLAVVRDTGAFNWDYGNLPGTPAAVASDIVLKYGQTYHISGWTILSSSDGTRFTNDATGHGMFVSVENVYSF